MGESTTAGHNNWPDLTEKILDKKFEKINFEFINKGINSTKSHVLVSKTPEYIKKYNPDIIVSMMGANDSHFKTPLSNFKYTGEKKPLIDNILIFLEENSRIYKFITLLKNPSPKAEKEPKKPGGQNNQSFYIETFAPDNNIKKGIEKCKNRLKEDPKNARLWTILGWLTYAENRPIKNKAQEYFKKALELNPWYYNAYYGFLQTEVSYSKENIKVAKKALKHYPNDDFFYSYLIDNISNAPVSEKEKEQMIEKNSQKNFEFSQEPISQITKHNYNKLYELTKQKDIQLIAMQYPTRNLKNLKNKFSEERRKDIVFVSNKKNFKEAIEKFGYKEIFQDRCYENFGHMTLEGRKLIAKNLASIIEKEFDFK